MKLIQELLLIDEQDFCETVYVDEANGIILTQEEYDLLSDDDQMLVEAKQQWKRFGMKLKRQFRCTSGRKKGKIVSDASKCSVRPDPKKIRQGRRTMRMKKNTIKRKTAITKKKAISKLVTKLNKGLMGTS
jgi:hypothetical protein